MPKLSWYVQRATAMPPTEFPWRLWRLIRAQAGRFSHWPSAEVTDVRQYLDGDLGEHVPSDDSAVYAPSACDLGVWPHQWRQRCLDEANALLDEEVRLFEFRLPPVTAGLDWHRDYSSGCIAPRHYAPALDYRDVSKVGDVKVIWELSRMQHVVQLAQAWRLSRDRRFAEAAVDQMKDWIRANPWMEGVNWVSPMECALRLISWTWAVRWISDSDVDTPDFSRLMAASVHQHLTFVHGNYSLYSSANNHLVAEASGAYIAAAFWKGLKCAPRVRERARQHLVRECLQQNLSDGVNREQTFSYQAFVWDLLALAALVGRQTGDVFPDEYWKRLEAMAEFIANVMDENGNVPNVGDQDDAVVIKLGTSASVAHREVLSLASVLFERDDLLAWAGGRTTERTAWLTGAQRVANTGSRRSCRSFSFGGYHSFRFSSAGPEVLLLADMGSNGDSTGAHAHADALSIWLHVGGKPVIADPGTFSYQDTPLRQYFRATAQHNTLCFSDLSQDEYLNRFLWGKRGRVRLLQHEVLPEGGSIRGRVKWWDGGEHVRSVSTGFRNHQIELEDMWDGRNDAKLNFIIHPSVSVSRSGLRKCRLSTDSFFVDLEWDGGLVNVTAMPFSERCYKLVDGTRISVGLDGSSGRVRTSITWGYL